MAENQTTEISQSSQQAQEISVLTHEAKGTNRAPSWCPLKDLKPCLDAMQRVVCRALAVWAMYPYNNLWEFIAILAVNQIDPHESKDILVRVLKGLVSEGK